MYNLTEFFSGTKKLLMPVIQLIITIKRECEGCRFLYSLISLSVSSLTFISSIIVLHLIRCVFKEFPGCFACETDKDGYQFFLHFHYLCSTIAFILSSVLVGKILIAFPVVRDELANPTTAAPLGLLCMAFEKVFAGNFGHVGEGITFVAVGLHTTVAAW